VRRRWLPPAGATASMPSCDRVASGDARVATIVPNCYRTRRGFHLRRWQVTLSAAKLGARVGAVLGKARPRVESASELIDEKIKEPGDWPGRRSRKSILCVLHKGLGFPTSLSLISSPQPPIENSNLDKLSD
jgi:hypothetical protein